MELFEKPHSFGVNSRVGFYKKNGVGWCVVKWEPAVDIARTQAEGLELGHCLHMKKAEQAEEYRTKWVQV